MRYNAPPNWPKPPEGWEPPPGWSPDPAWPSPPPGWRLWIDDDAGGPQRAKAALGRFDRTGDDVEYFGDDRAWSDDAAQTPADDQLDGAPPPLPARPTAIAPEDLSVHHLGRYATIKWDGKKKTVIGKIVAVSADSEAISVKFDGLDTPVSFHQDDAHTDEAKPLLYVWI
jgi:hypothetical protein